MRDKGWSITEERGIKGRNARRLNVVDCVLEANLCSRSVIPGRPMGRGEQCVVRPAKVDPLWICVSEIELKSEQHDLSRLPGTKPI